MSAEDQNPWTTKFYPREGGGGFDRLVFFSDAVYAVALTLMAVEIGVPEAPDDASAGELWQAILEKLPMVAAYVVAFLWVAIYWRANHRFTATLRGVSSAYIVVTLIYLGFVAFLPVPAALLGQFSYNAVAVAVLAGYAACVSLMEVVLIVVADRGGLYLIPMTPAYRKQTIAGALSPIPGFLLSIPLAFVSTTLAIICWFVMSPLLGWAVSWTFPATPPGEPEKGS